MFVIYSQLREHIQLIAWTSDLKTAKRKLEEYVKEHLQLLDPDTTPAISTKRDIILDGILKQSPPFSAEYIDQAERNHGNIRQINIYTHETITGWISSKEKIDQMGYFAISQVNQTCNLYPANNPETNEILKDLEQESIIAAFDSAQA